MFVRKDKVETGISRFSQATCRPRPVLDRITELCMEISRNQSFYGGENMPHVQITWGDGRTPDQKRKIAERVTQVLVEDGTAKRENIHVTFLDLPETNYAKAGVLVSNRKRSK
jgi:4-oxalocrotonate tautomerase family enzyme